MASILLIFKEVYCLGVLRRFKAFTVVLSFLDQRCSDWSVYAPVHIANACSGAADKGGAFQF